ELDDLVLEAQETEKKRRPRPLHHLQFQTVKGVIDVVEHRRVLVNGVIEDQVKQVIGTALGLRFVALQVLLQMVKAAGRLVMVSDQQVAREDRAELRERLDAAAVLGRLAHMLQKLLSERVNNHEQIVGKLLRLGKVRRRVRLAPEAGDVFQRQR